MDYQECVWKNRIIVVTTSYTKSNKKHEFVSGYVGMIGRVIKTAKNGMLLIKFSNLHASKNLRAIPASCVADY